MTTQILKALASQLLSDSKDALKSTTNLTVTTAAVTTAVTTEKTAQSLAFVARHSQNASDKMNNWLTKRYADRVVVKQ